MEAIKWTHGPPPGAGRWWVRWVPRNGAPPRIEPVELSSAVLVPTSGLLIKMLSGIAYPFSGNEAQLSHHAPFVVPAAPESKEVPRG